MDEAMTPNRWQKFRAWVGTRTGKITLLGIVALIAVGIAAGVTYARYARAKQAGTAPENPFTIPFTQEASKPTTVASDLDGTLVAPDLAKRRPLAVMVENHPDARPQSGLNKAGVVVEAIAEGGITRFMAIFASQNAEKIGPVRSARPYFIEYASGWKAIYAHAGGSEGGLALLRTAPVVNLDNTNGYFHREPKPGLASEHTLYTSSDNLYKLATDRGATLSEDFSPWKFEDDPDSANRGTAQSATIDFSSPSYKVGWTYDAGSDYYLRTLAGSAHKDAVSGNQLVAENVAILTVSRQQDASANHGKGEWTMDTIGSGKVRMLKHGRTVEGTWKKSAIDQMVRFYDSDDKEMSLGRGLTWMEIVPPDSAVSIE